MGGHSVQRLSVQGGVCGLGPISVSYLENNNSLLAKVSYFIFFLQGGQDDLQVYHKRCLVVYFIFV